MNKPQHPPLPALAGFSALVLGAIALGLIGRSVELTLPLILGSAQEYWALSSTQLGLFAAAEVLGVTVTSGSSFLWFRHARPLRLGVLGLAAFAIGNAVTPLVTAEWLMPVRFLTACLGEGVLLVVATATLGGTTGASRIYAAYMASQMIMGALLLGLQGQLAQLWGVAGVMASLILLAALALPALLPYRMLSAPSHDAAQPHVRGIAPASFAILIGMGIFHLGIGGAWAFMQQGGAALGMDFATGGWVLGAVMASGVIGNIGAFLTGDRLGLRTPLMLGALGLGAGGALIGLAPSLTVFVAGGALMMMAWNASVPYQITLLGGQPGAANALAQVPAFQGAGLAAGPMLVGLSLDAASYAVIAVICVLAAALSGLCFALGTRQ